MFKLCTNATPMAMVSSSPFRTRRPSSYNYAKFSRTVVVEDYVGTLKFISFDMNSSLAEVWGLEHHCKAVCMIGSLELYRSSQM